MIINRWLDTLYDILAPHIFKGINEMYNNIKQQTNLLGNTTGYVKAFQ
jgi:hypothetical protein